MVNDNFETIGLTCIPNHVYVEVGYVWWELVRNLSTQQDDKQKISSNRDTSKSLDYIRTTKIISHKLWYEVASEIKAWKQDERELDYSGEINVWKWSDQASNPADLWEEPLGNKARRSATPSRFMTGFMTRQPLSDPRRHTTVTFHKSSLIKQFISVFHTLATTFNITVLDTSVANIFLFGYIYRIVH